MALSQNFLLKKRQLELEEGEEGHTAAALFYALATASPRRRGHLTSHPLHTKMCASAPRKTQTNCGTKPHSLYASIQVIESAAFCSGPGAARV